MMFLKLHLSSMLILLQLSSIQVRAATSKADYVIVGAGTAGCALAARLCVSLPTSTFVLLERANPRNASQQFLVQSPRQVLLSWFTQDLTESFPSLPNTALRNRTFNLFTGKTLGGTSSINGMQYTVPPFDLINSWSINGFNAKSSERLYRKAFNQLNVAVPPPGLKQQFIQEFLRAARKAGFKKTRSPFHTGPERTVLENFLTVDQKGYRVDSCTAYLLPVIESSCRNNLKLIQGVTVSKIILSDSKPKKALGVEFVQSNDTAMTKITRLIARKEVILSAGPFSTPRLLQASGIGPAHVLKKAGVKVEVNLPVGRRCQARTFTSVNAKYKGAPLEPSNNATLVFSSESRRMFDEGEGGVLGIAPSFAIGVDAKNGYFGANGNTYPEFVGVPIINLGCYANQGARGYLRITSPNPFSKPDIQLSLLRFPSDIRKAMRCTQRLVRIVNNFRPRINISVETPASGIITEDYVRDNSGWNGHFLGCCPVGDVLKGDLMVKSVKKLRAIDASVLGSLPESAGPVSSVYAIVEHMAEVIASSS